MGVGLIKDLSTRARLTLLVMASVARDQPTKTVDARLYFGGWPQLGYAMGFATYDGSAERAVAKAIAELRGAGLIDGLAEPGTGHRQVYRITLPGLGRL